MMQLPKGVTGFYNPGEAVLPMVDTKAFTAVCYAAARSTSARVLGVDTQAIVRSYYRAGLRLASGRVRQIVCNRHYPLLAIALEATGGEFYPQFVDEPDLTVALSASGEFEVLITQALFEAPSVATTALLGKAELKQVDEWKPDTIGQILFNSWD